MSRRKEIQEELTELSSDLLYDKQPPVFTVPEGYFENFAASVLLRIKDYGNNSVDGELKEISPLLASIPRNMPYSIPDNYFVQALEEIPVITNETVIFGELKAAKQMPYNVPDDYFSSLSGNILSKIDTKPAAKVVHMSSRNWMRYAVAAVLAGVIMLSGIIYFYGSSGVNPDIESQAWVSNKLKDVSNEDLQEFIENADYKINGREIVQKWSKAEVKNMLNDVSDKELDAFLNSIPADDELLVIN
jgi:hypothetical protein